MMYLGIDPGLHTGMALMDHGRGLKDIHTTHFWGAIDYIKMKAMFFGPGLTVIIEDAGLNKPVFDRGHGHHVQLKIAQNVGSNKRDAQLLVDYCTREGVKIMTVRPSAKSRTKLTAEEFRRFTGYTGSTDQHGRDAAMLIYGM